MSTVRGVIIIVDRFDIDNLDKNVYYVGRLNKQVIDILNIKLSETDILFGKDKIKYSEKHKHKFRNQEEYKKHIELTPEIIATPDYVAIHPNGKSIEYIKKIDEIMLVAVRVRGKGVLWVKSVFPITKEKLQLYIDSSTAKKFKKS